MLSVVMLLLTPPSSSPASPNNPIAKNLLPWLFTSKPFPFGTSPQHSPLELFTSVDKPVGKLTAFSGVKPLA
jgi:hypothetical protein